MKSVLLLLFVLHSWCSFSQIYDPVEWSTTSKKISDTEYDLIITATIDEGWHLYSQYVPEGGPIPTTFTFQSSEDFELINNVQEEKGYETDDPIFEMLIKYFIKRTTFKQRIRVHNEALSTITGELEFMVCDDSKCLPPTQIDLHFDLLHKNFKKKQNSAVLEGSTSSETIISNDRQLASSNGLLSIFLLAFFSGFAALLTPCVFPMIPMTVSFFTKQSKTKVIGIRNSILYGVSIILIYVVLGSVVTAIFGADSLNALATNVWFNILFFILLVIFAISFMGAFEIMLPNSWANKVDSRANKGGMIGIFFMALALALVSFSCTGPIIGTLLVEAASKGGIAPIIGMLGFSLALALPFTLFAAFPGWLNSLPRSGGWLHTVKVVLGFLELALAFKFLSQADLVLQLHIIEREVFIAIWIAIFTGLTLYLFGKIKLPHDSTTKHISVGRLNMGLLSLAFVLYMTPGLWGAPLHLISAFPPPQHYSESPYGVGFLKTETNKIGNISNIPEGAHIMAPYNILVFNDYETGLRYAKKAKKPVMIDFTGHACVNCRKMEQNVWAKNKILNILKNDIVLISLYVDDKRPLPKNQEVNSKLYPNKKLKYIGQKWSELQTIKYKTNSQPYYVLMDHDEKNLIAPVAYMPDADKFHDWLVHGISNFK